MRLSELNRILQGLKEDRAEIDYDIERAQRSMSDLLVEKFENGVAIEKLEKEIERKWHEEIEAEEEE
ncbi:hypothetical protein [Rossellomorea marisflavi]|uniref:hypothetical protein n=1 Tax=Rossellomorea marisflavi TaxID=189381 RepID=UPI0009A6A0A1|nr:hypothetical protein [Rossellomorea marisflavi]